MLNFISKLLGKNEEDEQKAREDKQIIEDITYVCSRLRSIRASYDMVCEDELVEAMIYEEKALLSKYSYLLRVAKERSLTNIPAISQ